MFESVFRNSPFLIVVFDLKSLKRVRVNDAFEKITGYKKEEET